MDYGNIEKYARVDLAAGVNWNGASMRARLENKDVAFGYPVTGYPIWMDNAALIADATNVDNARLFLNFIVDPENAAMLSNFARYANGIKGSEAFMDEEMKNAPEIVIPEELKAAGRMGKTCPPEVQKIHTAIWTKREKRHGRRGPGPGRAASAAGPVQLHESAGCARTDLSADAVGGSRTQRSRP